MKSGVSAVLLRDDWRDGHRVMRLRRFASVTVLCLLTTDAWAHDPILSCFENKNGTITCEAGYSDGAPSAGQTIRVTQTNKRLILEGKFDKNSAYTFKKPMVDFIVEFIGDASHRATFDSEDLGK